MRYYPIIDINKTGQKIKQIMQEQGLNVRDIQDYLGLSTPQSVYHWFSGRNMPTIDNLYALSELFHMPVDTMLCGNRKEEYHFVKNECNHRLYLYYKKMNELKVS